MSSNLFSMTSVLRFLKKCNKFNQEISKSLAKIGRIELLNEMESLKREKIYTYYNQFLEFFKNRVDFIIECIEIESLNKEILEPLLRGLIEIYCRILFLSNSSDEEKLKKIIWQELYICALSDYKLKSNKSLAAFISINYKILQDIKVSLPVFPKIRQIVQESLRKIIQKSSQKIRRNQEFTKWNKQYGFPSVAKIIRDSLDEREEPIISKYQLYRLYSRLSEQIHADPYLEYTNHNSKDTGKYRIIAFLLIIYLKFLREIAKKAKMEKDIEELVKEASEFKEDFLLFWGFSKQLSIEKAKAKKTNK